MAKNNQVEKKRFIDKFLNTIEFVGNKLPDPAMLFLAALIITWILSALLSPIQFTELDPRTSEPIKINNLLTGAALADFLANMIRIFTGFAPLGIVLVAMLGIGVADDSGYINAGLKLLLGFTPKSLLTPMLIFVGIISHTAADAGYVLVIPLGGVIFHAAGRHPLSGIAAAFAGVSGGFSANIIPSGIDPLLQSFTQSAAQIIDPDILVNPLCNWYFTAASSILIIAVGWYITDKIIEPRLTGVKVDEGTADAPKMETLTKNERKGFWVAASSSVVMLILLVIALIPGDSPLRAPNGEITSFQAPIMQSIVPLIFLLALIPGVIYGYVSGTYKNAKQVIDSMTKAMKSMSYYLVMVFFTALFIDAFGRSNIGALLAIKGAIGLKALALPGQVTIVGIIILTALVNLLVGSASAKWALISPIFVPMLMQLGISPELTQAAYRIGDSSSNIITPLMPYFPLVVVFCQKYVKNTGIGTLVSLMLPFSIAFFISWTIFLLIYWMLGIPLGLQAPYTYP